MHIPLSDNSHTITPQPDGEPERHASRLGFFTHLALASHLDHDAYIEEARDSGTPWKIAAMLGIGGLALGWERAGTPDGMQALLSVGLAGLGWLAAAGVTWACAVGIPKTRHEFPEILRAVGFAGYPFLLFAIVASAGRGTPMLAPILQVGVLAFAAFSLYTTMRHVIQAPPNLSLILGLAALGAYMLPWVALTSLFE